MPSLPDLPSPGGGSVRHDFWVGGWGSWGGVLPPGGPATSPPPFPGGPITPPPINPTAPPPVIPVDTYPPATGTISPDRFYYPQRLPVLPGPRTRRRKKSPAELAKEAFKRCIDQAQGDSDYAACDRIIEEAFWEADRTQIPETPDEWNVDTSRGRVIRTEAVPLILPGVITGSTVAGILGPILAGGLLFPTAAGKNSDLRDVYAVPAPAASPRRPGRRPRRVPPPGIGTRPTSVRPPARPVARPSSGPVTISRPRIQAPASVATGEVQAPRPASLPATVQIQVGDIIASAPGQATIASSTAAPAVSTAAPSILSRVGQWANYALPFLPLALPFAAAWASPSSRPLISPLTSLQPNALTSPATAALPNSDACSRARSRDKQKKRKRCKNPTVSSRLETKGGKRYQIIKRWLKCPASSKRKPRLRLAR